MAETMSVSDNEEGGERGGRDEARGSSNGRNNGAVSGGGTSPSVAGDHTGVDGDTAAMISDDMTAEGRMRMQSETTTVHAED
jgi:hypothetical protein